MNLFSTPRLGWWCKGSKCIKASVRCHWHCRTKLLTAWGEKRLSGSAPPNHLQYYLSISSWSNKSLSRNSFTHKIVVHLFFSHRLRSLPIKYLSESTRSNRSTFKMETTQLHLGLIIYYMFIDTSCVVRAASYCTLHAFDWLLAICLSECGLAFEHSPYELPLNTWFTWHPDGHKVIVAAPFFDKVQRVGSLWVPRKKADQILEDILFCWSSWATHE